MTSFASRTLKHPWSFVLLASLAGGCGDDDDSTDVGLGGAGGSSADAGPMPGAGAAGDVSGGSGGTGGGPAAAAKDCGMPDAPAVPELVLTQIATGFERPVYVAQPPGDTARLFVVEKSGAIRIVRDGSRVEAPFLDIPGVSERGGEMGLLGLAFHPDYAENGRLFVYYSTLTDGGHVGRVAEYQVSSDNPDVADAASERVLLDVPQPQDNHNGGGVELGPDGMLYIGLGDGGGGGDQHGDIGNGQNLATLLGKILRVDVDGSGAGPNEAYAVPSGNIAADGALPEIWSYGWRNPWRYSFDACTGDMYIADVGQNELEEVNFEPANTPGLNYGWRLMEGDACFNPMTGCDAAAQNLVLPVATYGRNVGVSITGGYVYRGAAIPELRGTYLYADFDSARFFALRMQGGSVALEQTEITDNINPGTDVGSISSFGQDNAGNLYVVSLDGGVYRIDAE